MFQENNTGQTHYVGDGCNPPHLPLNSNKRKNLKQFKEFLAKDCADLQKYKEGKYDLKIFNWIIKNK